MNFGKRLQELRKKNNLSQEELAEKIGVARQTISKWELGETAPDLKESKKLSLIFKVSLDELTDNKVDRKDTKINKKENNFLKHFALFFADLGVVIGSLFFILFILEIAFFGISCLVISICLLGKINIANLIPYIPYYCGVIMSISLISLTILLAIACYYLVKLLCNLISFYKKFHYNTLNNSNNSYDLVIPSLSKKLKIITIILLLIFIIFFILTIISCIISSDSLEFWHTWKWWI